MATLIMHTPMPRMLGIPAAGFHSLEVPLEYTVTLEDFFRILSRDNPNFIKVIDREQNTYFEQIRIFVDGALAVSNDYSVPVHPDSEVALLPPYVDG